MKLILTEKPNVTKQVKDALAPNAKYIRVGQSTSMPLGYYENDEFLICNTVGHCISILNPKDISPDFTWNLDKVPYAFPSPLPLQVSPEKKSLFNLIQTCFSKYHYDEVIIATDGDREGQNIWRKINLMLKPYKADKITRMWLSEWTAEGIRDAYYNRFPNSDKDSLADAAQCREEADYIIGMDCSVALTCKYAKGKGNVASIGRVMGPTMYIVYSREQEIKNFKPELYTDISLTTATDSQDTLTLKRKSSERLSKTEAATLKNSLSKISSVVLSKETKQTSKRAPELYDATTIAQDMNKRYGYSAKKTSDIIQKLYQDYALTTYPGTNARKISEGSAKKVYQILNNLTVLTNFTAEIKANGWTVSPHVVTSEGLAHEAITPVYGSINPANVAKLSKDEMNVYMAIVERFLAVFYPKAVYEEVTVSTEVSGETFETRGKSLLEPGWTVVLGTGKDVLLPTVTDGKSYRVISVNAEDKKTTPPSRYTEETLLSAMKNAGRFVEDANEAAILNSKEVEGLGTGRTRPAIIENIKHRGYFVEQKKYIYPTEKCCDLFDVLPNTTLSSPSLTAQFEQMIQDVEDGNMTKQEYMDKINEEVQEIIEKIKADNSGKSIGEGGTKVGSSKSATEGLKCPFCGAHIVENSKAYGCSNWKNGCKFTIWKEICGKKLTKTQVKSLIENKQTGLIKGFTGKSGKTFDAYLVIDDTTKSAKFSFDAPSSKENEVATDSQGKAKEFGLCPKCGKKIFEYKDGWRCTGCGCTLKKDGLAKLGGKKITKSQAKKLLEGEIIDVNLVSKAGKPYTAKAYFDHTNGWVKVSFNKK